jgi:hypothetical protein
MRTIPSFLRGLVVALALAGSFGAALAAPTHHVNLDTSSLAGTTGYIDLYFSRDGGAPASTVTLSNFVGGFGAEQGRTSDVTGAIPGSVVFGSTDGWNDLFQAVSFGGALGFDVEFGGDFALTTSSITSLFGVGLLNQDQSAYLGANGDLVQFTLVPMGGQGAAGVSVATFGPIASVAAVSAVPEPSELLLMTTGLGLVGFMLRRRKLPLAG